MSAGPGSEAEDTPMPVYTIIIYQCPDKFCASYAHDYSTIYSFIYIVVPYNQSIQCKTVLHAHVLAVWKLYVHTI